MNLKIIGILLALGSVAFAQPPPPTIKIKLLPVSIGGNVEKLFFKSGERVLPFEAYQLGFGPALDYSGPRRFVLHASQAAFAAEPPGPPPVAFADLPLNTEKVLLLCVPDTEGKLRLVTYDISKKDALPGDYRIFNLSQNTISVILGDKKFVVNPAGDKTISDQDWRSGVRDINFQLATVANGAATKIYSSMWGHQPGRRNFIFLVNGKTATMPIEILRFYDVPAADLPPAE
jgi:hypothetical protein